MKVIVAPLNWGLGHATRCIPIINEYLRRGDEVVLAGDGNSLTLLRKRYPNLRYIELPELQLHYSNTNSQIWTLLKQIPHCLLWAMKDHSALDKLLDIEHFDLIISDNRFFFYTKRTKAVYLTHQLNLILPKHWRWLTPVANLINRRIINKYAECWVADREPKDGNLAGKLSMPVKLKIPLVYKGILSRFSPSDATPHSDEGQNLKKYNIVAVLSGLEPQRTIFEKEIINTYIGKTENVLIIEGKIGSAYCERKLKNITILPYLDDKTLANALRQAETIVARSGYSTIMDLYQLGVLHKARLVPTPGQTEQEYLALIPHSDAQRSKSFEQSEIRRSESK